MIDPVCLVERIALLATGIGLISVGLMICQASLRGLPWRAARKKKRSSRRFIPLSDRMP